MSYTAASHQGAIHLFWLHRHIQSMGNNQYQSKPFPHAVFVTFNHTPELAIMCSGQPVSPDDSASEVGDKQV